MELFAKLFGILLFVYRCFDLIVIHGYLSGLSRPEQVTTCQEGDVVNFSALSIESRCPKCNFERTPVIARTDSTSMSPSPALWAG